VLVVEDRIRTVVSELVHVRLLVVHLESPLRALPEESLLKDARRALVLLYTSAPVVCLQILLTVLPQVRLHAPLRRNQPLLVRVPVHVTVPFVVGQRLLDVVDHEVVPLLRHGRFSLNAGILGFGYWGEGLEATGCCGAGAGGLLIG